MLKNEITEGDVGNWYINDRSEYVKIISIYSIEEGEGESYRVVGRPLYNVRFHHIFDTNGRYVGSFTRKAGNLFRQIDDLEIELLGLEDIYKQEYKQEYKNDQTN